MLKILAIETSCDETAMAIVECPKKLSTSQVYNFNILAEAVSSQIPIHRPYGGVVPRLAKREHIKNLPLILKKISTPSQGIKIDLVAVTVGPGLEPALWTGVNFANDLAKKIEVPIVGVNHLEGHIFSNWLNLTKFNFIKFPAVVLLVSGGHTILLLMENIKKWRKLGETRDDAVGEAFDKVARMLKLPYPGGPEIEKLAINGHSMSINFPMPMIRSKNYDFSFSGLKTAVLYYLRDQEKQSSSQYLEAKLPDIVSADVAAAFQRAAVGVLVKKTMRAVEEFRAKSVLLCGGVAANKALQKGLNDEIAASSRNDISFYVPELKYNTDNAVMIAVAACLGNHYPTDRALPDLSL